ncbi:MAG TPA: efflux RND transporter periplasmic adaptor subunit [Rhodanobacteraceae bacterium]|nr:efflux RND transporter periplasmic adaptor subunit [Rhodanobacteraceae bacterium]
MIEASKKVALPAYITHRCEAFRIVKGDEYSYVIRDKVRHMTYDFDPWQYFILEVLPGCETFEKLQSVFKDRYNRTLTRDELDEFLASVADRELYEDTALQHPLLVSFATRTYEVVNGKPVAKSFMTQLRTPEEKSSGYATAPKAVAPAQPLPEGEARPVGTGGHDLPGDDKRTRENMHDLFDPRPILRWLGPLVAPLRCLVYVIPALLLLALLLVTTNWHAFSGALSYVRVNVGLGVHLLFWMLTMNVSVLFVRACVAHNLGAQVEAVGYRLDAGYLPRFDVGVRYLDKLTRTQNMWYGGAVLVMYCFWLSVGIFIWYFNIDRPGSFGNVVGVLLVLCSVASLLIGTGNPFVNGSGYYLLCSFLNEPNLRHKAVVALLNKIHGKAYQQGESSVLVAYGLVCISYMMVLTCVVTVALAIWLGTNFSLGLAPVMLAIFICGYIVWRNYTVLKGVNETYLRTQQYDRWRTRTLVVEDEEDAEVKTPKKRYWLYVWLIFIFLLLFVPYPYDVSGTVLVYPVRKQVISTDTPGLIQSVYFDGGESVKKGTVIAVLVHDDYTAKVKIDEANIEAQKSVIANLKSLPKPEEVKVAEQNLQVAQTAAKYSAEKVPRLQSLYAQGAVAFEDLQTAKQEADTDASEVLEKQAALALAKTGPTPDEIAAAEAKLASLVADKALYEGKLTRTTLRMPFDGNILTLHLKDRINSYLNQGDPFAAVEYTGTVTAQIDINESDLQYVKIGSKVRMHPTAYFNYEFDGVVTQIDRNVTTNPAGTFAAVIATFQNKDGRLKTGMTGEAKIDGPVIPVWQAFTQGLQHFFQVDVWSWIP